MTGRFDRRRFFRMGGTLAAATAVGGLVPIGLARPAAATVPDSLKFLLDGGGDKAVWMRSLHANWIVQSFGYDQVTQHIYFLQSEPGSTTGDIWVTKTTLAGVEVGAMALHGFGHGVSIGVENYQGTTYLWTEWKTSGSGYGTQIGRFSFQDDVTLEADSPDVQDRTPNYEPVKPGYRMINPQPSIDPWTNRLAVRYRDPVDTTDTRIVVYSLAAVRNRRPVWEDRLAERHLPNTDIGDIRDWPLGEPDPPAFQGYAVCGRYAYLLFGDNGSAENAYLVTCDLNSSGTQHDRPFMTSAGASLPIREAQGMAIWITSGGQPRLCFGFKSNDGGEYQASVFYKEDYTP